jgi:23S rRNA pseudouridine2605 synthase
MRLAKFLATAGVASRRAAEEIVRAERVTVNGETVTDPARDVSQADLVAVDGTPVAPEAERAVYLVNKPAGVVSTASDPQRRRTVVSLVPSAVRLYPVGRLDIDTTGLILLTNDGELAHGLTHPRFGVAKTYRARVAHAPVGNEALQRLRQGVELDDGPTAPAKVATVAGAPNVLRITIHEGRNRQVRRMCEEVGHPVRRLVRTRIGPLAERRLKPGEWRPLSLDEVRALERATATKRP